MSTTKPKFPLGRIVATPGAIEVLQEAGQLPIDFLSRHASGDWGDVNNEDWRANDLAVEQGTRILSAYTTAKGENLWIITEWDRSYTTLLRPDEY